MKPDMPPREKIERILEAATYAPNHHEVEPWKFFVMSGKALVELGELMREQLAAKMEETTSEKAQAALEKERNKPLRAPVIIAVASLKPSQPKVKDIENYAAVSAAVQNMLLVAVEEGLVSIWRTGNPVYDERVKAFFGLEPHEHLVGFIYLGYPAVPVPEREPAHFSTKTVWMNGQD